MNSKYFLSLAIVFSLFLASCGSDNESLFTIEMEADLNIGAGLNNVETHFFILRAVPTQINSYLSSRNVPKEAIDRVLASRAALRGRFSDIDFRIIEKISIWVISRQDETLKREAFFLDFVPNNQSGDLKLFSSISEVKEILLDDLIDIEIRVKLRAITPTNLETRLSLSFEAFGLE